ncbi:hypothetical protein A0H81_03218 [Grifola frondosa]|uniref:Uncharacterized protein n=1 Tax=Grifola frondosa TaxID=5627 RepID=A0A1C7MIF2_GRIFR|nr:hypothetical protein A0H81_03218 [Grifola frondosa]
MLAPKLYQRTCFRIHRVRGHLLLPHQGDRLHRPSSQSAPTFSGPEIRGQPDLIGVMGRSSTIRSPLEIRTGKITNPFHII